MSVDYLLVFNDGEYRMNEDEFKEQLLDRFADARVGRSSTGDDSEPSALEWTYGLGDERVDGRAAEDLSAMFIHSRSNELGIFVEWIRQFLPSEVRVLLTNEAYSFDFEVPANATAGDITDRL